MRNRTTLAALVVALIGYACGAADGAPQDLSGVIGNAPFTIRVPSDWNGTLLVYAHGYGGIDDFTDNPSMVEAAPGGGVLHEQLLDEGYALAASGFSGDGWAVAEGMADTEALTMHFADVVGPPERTILWGASMGSVIALALAEQSDLYDGVIAMCAIGAGATGTFDASLAVALAYDAAFGWPSAWGSPGDVRDDLDFEQDVLPVLFRNAADDDSASLVRFMQAVGTLPDEDPVIWFTAAMFFATAGRAELEARAGGPVSQNTGHVYAVAPDLRTELESLGLDVDALLARMSAEEITADPAARSYVSRFADFTGAITAPVLTLHTTVDGLVPVEHESAYAATVAAAERGDLLVQAYSDTYPGSMASGHCTFTDEQLLTAVEAMDGWASSGTAPAESAFAADEGFVPGFVPGPWPLP